MWVQSLAQDAKKNIRDSEILAKDASSVTATKFLSGNADTIQSAVTDLGTVIIDQESAKELHTLAAQAALPISGIQMMVIKDNEAIESNGFAPSMESSQQQAIRDMLHTIYDDPKVNAYERYKAAQVEASWNPALITKGRAIADALGKLKAANDELAAKHDETFRQRAVEAYAIAQEAAKSPSQGEKQI